MPRSLLDDPAFASIGRRRSARSAPRRSERAKLALAMAMLLAAGGFFAWHAGVGRGPTPYVLTREQREEFDAGVAKAAEIERQPDIIKGTN